MLVKEELSYVILGPGYSVWRREIIRPNVSYSLYVECCENTFQVAESFVIIIYSETSHSNLFSSGKFAINIRASINSSFGSSQLALIDYLIYISDLN